MKKSEDFLLKSAIECSKIDFIFYTVLDLVL